MKQTEGVNQKTTKEFKWKLIIAIGIFEITIILFYGFFSSFIEQSKQYATSLQYIFTNMLAFLGFGLLLIQYKSTINHTFILILIVAAVTIQLSPLLQKFWFNAFTNGFFQKNYKAQDLAFGLINDTSHNQQIKFSFGYAQISTHCMISLLVALGGIVGNIRAFNIIFLSILFNIGFTLNYYLNFQIYRSESRSNNGTIMDDFQGSRVFLFGASFGIPLMVAYNYFQPVKSDQLKEKEESIYFSQEFSKSLKVIGAIFFISGFYYVMDSYTTNNKGFGLLNIYFATSGALLSSIGISMIIFCQTHFEIMIMSMISGVMEISILGAYLNTPFASIVIGAFAGIVTTLLGHFLHKNKINEGKIIDANGIFVVYFVNTFLCSFFVTPITILISEKYGFSNTSSKSFHMKYSGISLGIGIGFGLIGALMTIWIRQDKPIETRLQQSEQIIKQQVKLDENSLQNANKSVKLKVEEESRHQLSNEKKFDPITIQI